MASQDIKAKKSRPLRFLSVKVTNLIRFAIDELLPPIVRDNRLFMLPFFAIWFKGKNIRTYMDFKSIAYSLSDDEFTAVYEKLDSLARNRLTDTNEDGMTFALSRLERKAETVLDVGCGQGYFLSRISDKGKYRTFGCDVMPNVSIKGEYIQGNVENLPFESLSFDIVTCCHTLEHVRHLEQAIHELKRVARRQVIVIVPRQRYFYYTLDLHLNFFPIASYLIHAMEMDDYECRLFGSDWVYIGRKSPPACQTDISVTERV